MRVNEGGMGDLRLFVSRFRRSSRTRRMPSSWTRPGNGDVHSLVLNSDFSDNGDQLQFPDEAPAGFPAGEEYEKDLEDGFDIDENDAGSIARAQFV